MAREYFCAYHSMIRPMQKLSDAERGRLFMALLQYSAGDELIKLQGREEIAFDIYAEQIDRDREAYEAKCAALRQNGMNGGRPEKPKKPNGFSETKCHQDKDKDKDKGEDKDNSTNVESNSAQRRFVPPSVEEVKAYCKERGNSVDAQKFVDFYASKGWKVGNQGMKDWKAAVRTWEQRDGKGKAKPAVWEDDDVDRLMKKMGLSDDDFVYH